ncbi:anoctamin-8-like isoform X3 [Convolutriloba macropyga]|uniref:anoctamin-8-like isoform X3 n=1 Tax=Convolutriloba macropyga TaxID=536237 RepID=UPI003F52659D
MEEIPSPESLGSTNNSSPTLRPRFGGKRRMAILQPRWTVPPAWCSVTKPSSFTEVVMILNIKTNSDSADDLRCADWLRKKLVDTKLDIRVGDHNGSIAFFISANYQVLLSQSEESRMRKELKPEYGGGLNEITLDQVDFFLNVESEDLFFSSQERQFLILDILNGIKAAEDEETPFTNIRFLEDQPIIAVLEAKKIIMQLFPLHEKGQMKQLVDKWIHISKWKQPIDSIKEYFGTEIAFYFAWLGYYTWWLSIPAVIGFIVWWMSSNQYLSDVFAVLFSILNVVWVTLFLEFWKRRSSALAYTWGTLDTQSELLQYPRALFQGSRQYNDITCRYELFYPGWKRLLFIACVTIPTLCVSLVIVFGSMFLTLELQNWMDLNSEWAVMRMMPKIVLSVLVFLSGDFYQKTVIFLNDKENYRTEYQHRNGLIVKLGIFHFTNNFFSLFYIAFYLRDMTKLKEFLAALLITRQLVGNFKEVFVPFLMNQFKTEKLSRSVTECQENLTDALNTSLKTTQIKVDDISASYAQQQQQQSPTTELYTAHTGLVTPLSDQSSSLVSEQKDFLGEENVKKIKKLMKVAMDDATGTLKRMLSAAHIRQRKMSADEVAKDTFLTQAAIESEMSTYAFQDLFDDYLEMFIQLGYVVFFSSLFPLAALCSCVNNVFEIRVDAFKITHAYRRPFAKTASGIGVWQNMMDVMGAIAVMVNCALLVSSGQLQRLFPSLSLVEIIVIAVVLEHIALLLKWFISKLIPDIPQWVEAEMAKVEFKRIQALRDLETLASRGHMILPQHGETHTKLNLDSPDGELVSLRARNKNTPTTETSSATTPHERILRLEQSISPDFYSKTLYNNCPEGDKETDGKEGKTS